MTQPRERMRVGAGLDERLLAGFISDSDLVMLVVAGQDISWKLDRLKQVHAELAQTDATNALNNWIDGAMRLNSRRNELVHSVWTSGPDGVPTGFRVKSRGKWDLRAKPVTADMLAELLAQVTDGVNLAVTISADLTGHPQWKGHRIDQALMETDRTGNSDGGASTD
jgi:hypothetical protein